MIATLLFFSVIGMAYCAIDERHDHNGKRPYLNFFVRATVTLALLYLFFG
jgi:hypothetical protein